MTDSRPLDGYTMLLLARAVEACGRRVYTLLIDPAEDGEGDPQVVARPLLNADVEPTFNGDGASLADALVMLLRDLGETFPTREQYEEDGWLRCESCGRYVHPDTPIDGDGCAVCAECDPAWAAAHGGPS